MVKGTYNRSRTVPEIVPRVSCAAAAGAAGFLRTRSHRARGVRSSFVDWLIPRSFCHASIYGLAMSTLTTASNACLGCRWRSQSSGWFGASAVEPGVGIADTPERHARDVVAMLQKYAEGVGVPLRERPLHVLWQPVRVGICRGRRRLPWRGWSRRGEQVHVQLGDHHLDAGRAQLRDGLVDLRRRRRLEAPVALFADGIDTEPALPQVVDDADRAGSFGRPATRGCSRCNRARRRDRRRCANSKALAM